MEKFLKIWRFIIIVIITVLMIAMLFISSEYFHMIVTKIILPAAIAPYVFCVFIYYKLGPGRNSHEKDNKQKISKND